jgi:1-aminocyclopropane-1-carboxylate deaminase
MFESSFLTNFQDEGPFHYEPGNIELYIRQLAKYEPIAGGNKLFKLKYNLQKARECGKTKILTFGGAFSNHIAAVALAGKIEGFETLGIIRGEQISISNVTLSRASCDGMQLIFVSREDYRRKNDSDFLSALVQDIDSYFIIPEGGANADGVKGCIEILGETDSSFDYITVCCGTGTTAAGIILSMQPHQKLLGFSILRDQGFMEKEIQNWIDIFQPTQRLPLWEINHDFHFGGYAKSNAELDAFCKNFQNKTGVAIEPVYTGKMFWGLEELIEEGYFKTDTKVLSIHTGGLQYKMCNFGEYLV